MKDKNVHGLEKIPDSEVIIILRQELGKANAYIDELKDNIKENQVRKVKNGTVESLTGRILNLEKQLKKYRAMRKVEIGREDDLSHWCSYNGIDELNKRELSSIIKSIIKRNQ